MQCPSCQFENLPGVAACARCQSVLAPVEVAVVPRRASVLRITTRALRLWYPLRGAVAPLRIPLPRSPILLMEPLPWGAVLRTLIPGWGHRHLGQRRVGTCLLALWACLILAAILMVATPWANHLLFGAVSVHALAFIMLMAANLCWERMIWRCAFGAALGAVLYFFIYGAITGTASRFICPYVLQNLRTNPLVATGDGLLAYGPWLKPKRFERGDLVLYEIPASAAPGYLVRAGYGLDRILALPGEHICYAKGQFTVNGQPLPDGVAPLASPPVLPKYEATLGMDEYGILSSLLDLRIAPQRGATVPLGLVHDLVIVRHDRVMGRVFWRLRPWARFGAVQ